MLTDKRNFELCIVETLCYEMICTIVKVIILFTLDFVSCVKSIIGAWMLITKAAEATQDTFHDVWARQQVGGFSWLCVLQVVINAVSAIIYDCLDSYTI